MWNAIAALGFAAISAKAQKQSGDFSLQSARSQAYDIGTSIKINEAKVLQEQARRAEELRTAEASNMALFSTFSDASSSKSVQAFLNKQREIAGSDIGTISFMGEAEKYRLQTEKRVVMEEGYARKTSANIGALTTMATGIYRFGQSFSTGGSE